MRTSNGLYTLLQVLPTADPAVIEAAYKALMKKYHPDLHAGDDAERRAAEINRAFTVLRDPERRAAYDADERAREERYRVELARAFPEPGANGGGSTDPGRRAPSPRPPRSGQRVAGWVGAAGALVLVGTIILFARGEGGAPPRMANDAARGIAASVAADRAVNPAAAPVPFRDEPVSGPRVTKAVAEFRRVVGADGMQGAAAFSERCFEAQGRALNIGLFDYCVAFDHAAGRADLAPADASQAVAFRRFQPQNQVARHVRAADPMADTFASIEIRLYEIRRLADAAYAQLPDPAPTAQAAAPAANPPPAMPPRRYTARPDPPQRRPARPARQRPQRQDQDFLEREGGIY